MKVLVEVLSSKVAISVKVVVIWANIPEKAIYEIKEIEGVFLVRLYPDGIIHAFVDPRYDADQVAAEIRGLGVKTPDVFIEER